MPQGSRCQVERAHAPAKGCWAPARRAARERDGSERGATTGILSGSEEPAQLRATPLVDRCLGERAAQAPNGGSKGLLQGPAFATRDRLAFLTQVAPQGAGILQANGVRRIIIEFDEDQAL